ncbi:alkaline phosphatase D family protein [Saccharomonospora xinjiangensis]|uniref:Phosphodiesterase/alkaline phosphatase D n=1 Tax=Saccharomonospora xinjiangensis XJ-54 TaxID=882086 RepID=I0V0Z3_9PSEU|nr:alkaline phosphatase D family protein [Saccharomonospora xinjiangensis]EID53796.1 phosphodiesterase/alkaline phosphatase D [Saccharomonospora xinjiangensis XJ-54]
MPASSEKDPSQTVPSRRQVLLGGAALGTAAFAAAGALGGLAPAARAAAAQGAGVPLRGEVFTLGVASGEPDHHSVVLWTRLATDPLAEDGLGGLGRRAVTVQWELAEDERFRHVVRRGHETTDAEAGYAVHAEIAGLAPGREYFYRFRCGRFLSPTGRTRTAQTPGTFGAAMTMAFASCSQYEHGYFTAYRHLAEDEPDLVLHLGDYIYEYKPDTYVSPDGNVRDHRGPETETLANYRQRYAQYRSDADLQAAHAVAPWLVVPDDHEVDNNWAGDIHEKPHLPQPDFLQRRANAFRAYYENMPLRHRNRPQGSRIQLYRTVSWGSLVNFHMLDTRQYRDDQACGDGWKICEDAVDPARSLTGDDQEQWLLEQFRRSRARWDLLGQQVFFASRVSASGSTSMDAWDGYRGSRERISDGWVEAGVRNPVVLTGDVHTHWANELKADYANPDSPVIGTELVTSSITSGGNGADSDPAEHPDLRRNPHIRFRNNQRGYVRTHISREELRADFRVVEYVTRPGAPVRTRASFVIADRHPGLSEVTPR